MTVIYGAITCIIGTTDMTMNTEKGI